MKGMINMKHFLILSLILLLAGRPIAGQTGDPPSRVWVADQGDGTYKNPVLHADYSDPDVIRVGTDYFMTASSFNCVPGLPVLHSKDLVNWKLIGHALHRLTPEEEFSMVRHGKGYGNPVSVTGTMNFTFISPIPTEAFSSPEQLIPRGRGANRSWLPEVRD